MKNYDNIKDLISDINSELFEIALHNIELFANIVDVLMKNKIWEADMVVEKYTSFLYGNSYSARDFTYAERPHYIETLEELKSLVKNKELKDELKDTIKECERIQMGGEC